MDCFRARRAAQEVQSALPATLLFVLLFFFPVLSIATPDQKFIVISDIHFDPFLGCNRQPAPCSLIQKLQEAPADQWKSIFKKYHYTTTIPYQKDTNYLLLDSVAQELKSLQSEHPQFIILLGDTLAHHFNDKYATYAGHPEKDSHDFTQKTIDFVEQQLQSAIPETPIYPVIGNNDSELGNYDTMPNSDLLSHMADAFSHSISDSIFHDAFSHAGFYAISLSPHQRLIVLNSVLFSTLRPASTEMDGVAQEQLSWLKKQLVIAKRNNQSALISMHIPAGIDIFKASSFNPIYALQDPNLWKTTYTQSFWDILSHSPAPITGMLVSHLHKDTFQIAQRASVDIPILFTSSISPIYNNNPSFKIMTLSDTNGLTDFDTYFYPLEELGSWQKEYNFNDTYQPGCQSCQILQGLYHITPNHPAYYAAYQKYFFTSHDTEQFSAKQWKANQCAITHFDIASYQTCTSGSHSNRLWGLLKSLFSKK